MASALKYMIDDSGHKQSVLVPLNKWKELNENYTKLLNKVRVMTEIKKGLNEIKEAQKTGKKLQTLKSFLDESNC